MAIIKEAAKTWLHEASEFNIRTLDGEVRSDGQVVLAWSGSGSDLNGLVKVGLLNETSDSVTDITATSYPQAAGGLPAAVVQQIDLEAGPGGRMAALLPMTEWSTDLNNALLVQRYSGTAAQGAAAPVNPASQAEATAQWASLVYAGDGSYSVFYYGAVSFTDTSSGIYRGHFGANGKLLDTKLVIADRVNAGIVAKEANPIFVDAVRMKGGDTGLVWTESTPFASPTFGTPKVMYQTIGADGVAKGTALEIDATSATNAQIIRMDSGRMAVVWQDNVQNSSATGGITHYKGQILSATGAKVGGAFEISSTVTTQETDLQMTALSGGGFAVSWRDMSNQVIYGRMFSDAGKATGADFQLIDTGSQFGAGHATLFSKAGALYAGVYGLNATVGTGFVVQGEVYDTASSWGSRRDGLSGADTMDGTGKDDVLGGLGGNDLIRGLAGNDALNGGLGADTIAGGAGFDAIRGGSGADLLTGGGGADTFLYASAAEGRDRITDFNGAEGDRLVFTSAGFGNATGILSGASDPGHMGLFYNTGTGVLTYDADGTGGAATQVVAKLGAGTVLAFDDYLFV